MLKTNILTVIILAFYLTSCSSLPEKGKNVEKVSPPTQELNGTTFFELLKPGNLRIIFKSVDTGAEVFLTLKNVITQKVFEQGYWEIIGFEADGKNFRAINERKRFVLRVKNNQITYGGSVLIGCPRVGQEQNSLLKDMAFFDRYPFSSDKELCELIVGNKLKSIKPGLDFSSKIKKLKVEVGF